MQVPYLSCLLAMLTHGAAAIAGAPSNDLCGDARSVLAGEVVGFSTVGASRTAVSPGCANFGGPMGPDVWFRYAAQQDGLLTIDLCQGTNFDCVVAVYEGADCANLARTPRGCNNGACGSGARIDVTVRAGTTYSIQVGGFSVFDEGTGTLQLGFQPGATVPFDECIDAGDLPCGGSVFFDLAGASLAPGEPPFPCATGPTLGTVWFTFVAAEDTALLSTLDSFNAPLDTVLAVYEGSCAAPIPFACNDDLAAPFEDLSRLLLQGLTPGERYHVQVSGHVGGVSGAMLFPGRLSLSCPSPCEAAGGATRRSAGTNPEVYEVSGEPLLGVTLALEVDRGAAGGSSSLVFAFDTPASVTLGGGQTLLALDAGSGELFTGAGLLPDSVGATIDSYLVAVPGETALCGMTLHSQALVLGSGTYLLSNGQDLVLGF